MVKRALGMPTAHAKASRRGTFSAELLILALERAKRHPFYGLDSRFKVEFIFNSATRVEELLDDECFARALQRRKRVVSAAPGDVEPDERARVELEARTAAASPAANDATPAPSRATGAEAQAFVRNRSPRPAWAR